MQKRLLCIGVMCILASGCTAEWTLPEGYVLDCEQDLDCPGAQTCHLESNSCVDPNQPICGNGVVELGEACDLGRDNADDYVTNPIPGNEPCKTDCSGSPPYCGDNELHENEACDEGEGNDNLMPDACRADCSNPFCGDGVVDSTEACDDGDANSDAYIAAGTGQEPVCNASCSAMAPRCGDGNIDAGEACDDGNTSDDGNGCSETCQRSGLCGDNIYQNLFEACDDGGTTACGICNADCTGPGEGGSCGDGEHCPDTEACDDGFNTACGACNTDCTAIGTGSICGDGVHCTDTETCDDGFNTACGNCNATCTGTGTGSICGDGAHCLDTETCDDGFTDACGDCNGTCTGAGSGSTCGDGQVCPQYEGCDDSNAITELCTYGDTSCFVCNASCQAETINGSYCGDGIIQQDGLMDGTTLFNGGDDGVNSEMWEACDGTTLSCADIFKGVLTADCNVPNRSWLGDGYCDSSDGYNTQACGWDGGDCCASTCLSGPEYNCTNATSTTCQDPNVTGSNTTQCISDGDEACMAFDTSSCTTNDMVYVPAGPFMMGCNEALDADCYTDEKPYHQVHLDAFLIDKYEVTAGDYKQCEVAGACTYNGGESDGYRTYNNGRDNHPINYVSHTEAKTYCEWLGKRLPTEAEWEKAARGTDGRVFPWGLNLPSCSLAIIDNWQGLGCGQDSTWAVGSKPAGASPYGAHDLSGNVWEWVSNWYGSNYYNETSNENPEGPLTGSYRVLRGGSFYSYFTASLRTSTRSNFNPDYRYNRNGFRCAQ